MSKKTLLTACKVIHILINRKTYWSAAIYNTVCVYLLCVLKFVNIPLIYDMGHILHLGAASEKFSTTFPHFVNNSGRLLK